MPTICGLALSPAFYVSLMLRTLFIVYKAGGRSSLKVLILRQNNEIVSTNTELTFILNKKDGIKGYKVLEKLVEKNQKILLFKFFK